MSTNLNWSIGTAQGAIKSQYRLGRAHGARFPGSESSFFCTINCSVFIGSFPSSYLPTLVTFLDLHVAMHLFSLHGETPQCHYFPFSLKSTPIMFIHHCSIKTALIRVTNDHYIAKTKLTTSPCFVWLINGIWHGQLLLETLLLLDTTPSHFSPHSFAVFFS